MIIYSHGLFSFLAANRLSTMDKCTKFYTLSLYLARSNVLMIILIVIFVLLIVLLGIIIAIIVSFVVIHFKRKRDSEKKLIYNNNVSIIEEFPIYAIPID